MGRYISWRKTLSFVSLSTIFFIIATPLPSKLDINKSNNSEQTYNLQQLRHDYKTSKVLTFSMDIEPINDQLNKFNKVTWSKYLKSTFKRLLPYRDFIAKEAETQNVPLEIVYLPIIESGASSMAKSHKGATGLWQFMLNSSGAYNMHTTEWVDERRDFIKSTKAAITKLNYNFNKTGDWLLALAAYNCGLNRVNSVVKRSGIDNFWELIKNNLLPKETSNYIPKLLAVSSLIMDKKSYGITIKWEKQLWDELELTSAVDLRILSEKAEVPLIDLIRGNYELNYNVTPPTNTNYRLKVPSEYTNKIKDALSSQDQLLEFYRYKVKSGDTLSEIGYHYGISTNGLLKYNSDVTIRNLRVGTILLIPAIKEVNAFKKYRNSVTFKNIYIVKEGDTLWDISIKYDTTIEEIAENSGLPVNGYIKKGMRLKVP